MTLRKFNKFNEGASNDVIQIVWTESGDEIHFLLMEFSHLNKIEEILNRPRIGRTQMLSQADDNELIELVHENKLDSDFYQSGTTTDYKFSEYNIKKVLHLPQLGY